MFAAQRVHRAISSSRTASSWTAAGRSATTLTIKNGRIASVGRQPRLLRDARTIDLGGRTVIPGLFDAHVHYTRRGRQPGYEARRIERAFSIAELQEAIAERANRCRLARSSRASAAGTTRSSPRRAGRRRRSSTRRRPSMRSTFRVPVEDTGAITNTLGRAFFAAKGVMVDEATGVGVGAAAARRASSGADPGRQTARYRRSERARQQPRPDRRDQRRQPRRSGTRAPSVAREQADVRMRPLFPADSPQEVETRVLNNFSQGGRAVGDDLFRVAGFGERIGGTDTMSPQFEPTARMIASTAGCSSSTRSRSRRTTSISRRSSRSRASIRSTSCAGRSFTCRASTTRG